MSKATLSTRQAQLRLVTPISRNMKFDENSIVSLTRDLIRLRSQGGIDAQDPILRFTHEWLAQRGVFAETLVRPHRKPKNRAVGLLATLGDERKGPTICLTACLDTAPAGRAATWDTGDPFSAMLSDGWLHGRGSADSKVGAAIFCHLFAALSLRQSDIKGRIILLLDSDEHTGRFQAVKMLLEKKEKINFAFIGYPGNNKIQIGSRGFFRALVKIDGISTHSGAREATKENPILKASRLVDLISTRWTPISARIDDAIGLPPSMNITKISSGRSYSITPDTASVGIDFRLTTKFDLAHARKFLREAVRELDHIYHFRKETRIESEQSWPAYVLNRDSPMVARLAKSAQEILGRTPNIGVSGPSNVGNFFAAHGIPAISGFGANYFGIHAANERVEIATIMPIYKIYDQAIRQSMCIEQEP